MSGRFERIELACKIDCHFLKNCYRSFNLFQLCEDEITSLVGRLNSSLHEDPVLDKAHPNRTIEDISVVHESDSSKLIIMGKMTLSKDQIVAVRIGEIENGDVKFHGYSEQIIRRLQNNTRTVIVRHQS